MTESTSTSTASPETITILGWAQYGATYAMVTIEGETLYRDADGILHRACGRCGGQGVLVQYGHVYGGECFACCYAGTERGYADEKAARKAILRKQARQRREAVKREAAAVAALAASIEKAHGEALRMQAAMDRQAERAQGSTYAGEVGSKVVVGGRVVVAMTTEGMYGSKRFVILEGTGSDEGVTLKMSGTSAVLWDVEKGDEARIAGTVKAHEERQGVRQTVVIRAKEA